MAVENPRMRKKNTKTPHWKDSAEIWTKTTQKKLQMKVTLMEIKEKFLQIKQTAVLAFFAAMAGLGYRSNHCTSVQPMFLRKKIKKSFTPNTFLKFLFNTNSEAIAQFYSIRV